MQVMFVHGMGRSPISGRLLMWQLKKSGYVASSFAYSAALANFEQIRGRLIKRLDALAEKGDYVVIGHSLGGVLLRSAINALPSNIKPPRHLFLLGSPLMSSRVARTLKDQVLFRVLTGDCGQLLASEKRMSEIGLNTCSITVIVGTKGLAWPPTLFAGEINDGVVALSEVSADAISDQISVPVIHTWLPSSQQVIEIILAKLATL
jgi:hypothetical protein